MVAKLDCTGPCGDVVEFGCGYGTFTIPTAQQITGQLFALDIEPAMVDATIHKATEVGLTNVVPLIRDFVIEGTGLPDAQAGYAMVFNILHIEQPETLLREAYRVLKPGGKVGIIHWRTDVPTPRGPSLDIRPTPQQCRSWAEQVGFTFVREVSICCCSWHWGLVMQRPT
jgi:ubiquinone/menaquinone biosynthesis C-methylase UbiE